MENLKIYKARRHVDSTFLSMSLRIKEYGLDDVTFITLLKGGVYTGFNIFKNIPLSINTWIGYLGLSSYKEDTFNSNTFNITYKFDLTDELLKDRNVWIIDDICDSGKTLDRATGLVQAYKPKSIRTAVLIDKPHTREKNHFPKPDIVGFTYPGDNFLLGCGLGLGEKYRTLRELYELEVQDVS